MSPHLAPATAYERIVEAVSNATGRDPIRKGNAAQLCCPAHEDRTPSLSIRAIEGSALLHCHAGCSTPDVLAAVGLSIGDLYDDRRGCEYRYVDRQGKRTRTVRRTADKKFSQSGGKSACELFRLPEIVQAVEQGRRVLLVEGEKDVLAIESLGAVATTAPQGASNFAKVDVSPLAGANVLCIPDQDSAGEKWLLAVTTALQGVAGTLNVARPKTGKDAADHIAAGYDLDQFVPTAAPAVELNRSQMRSLARRDNRLVAARLLAEASETLGLESAICGVVKLMSEPPEYYLEFADPPGKLVHLGRIAILDSQTAFRRRLFDLVDWAPAPVRPAAWAEIVRDIAACAVHEQPDENTTYKGRARGYVDAYLSHAAAPVNLSGIESVNRTESLIEDARECDRYRVPFVDKKGTHVFLKSVQRHIRESSHGAENLSTNELAGMFKAAGFRLDRAPFPKPEGAEMTKRSTWIVRPPRGASYD